MIEEHIHALHNHLPRSKKRVLEELKGKGLNRYYLDKISDLPQAIKHKFPISQYDFKALAQKRDPSIQYIAGMATMPSRLKSLKQVIIRVLPQIDKLHIFLNNFTSAPDFLEHPKIHIHKSDEYGDLRDNGKFFGLQYANGPSDIYFTLDDDIAYPYGYFQHLHLSLERYLFKAVVGIHGAIYPKNPSSFFKRYTFNFERQLRYDTPVSVLGTGTVAFKATLLDFRDIYESPTGMADLVMAGILKTRSHPLICLARPRRWLIEINTVTADDSIYQETSLDSSRHIAYLKSQTPWGIDSIIKSVNNSQIEHIVPRPSHDFIDFLHSIEQKSTTKYEQVYSKHACFYEFGKLWLCNHMHYRKLANSIFASKYIICQEHQSLCIRLVHRFIQGRLGDAAPIGTYADFQDALEIARFYHRETKDQYVEMLLGAMTSRHVSQTIISQLFSYYDVKELRPLMESILMIKKLDAATAFMIERNLLINGISIMSQARILDKETLSEAKNEALLTIAALETEAPEKQYLALGEFMLRSYKGHKKIRDFRYFVNTLIECNREIDSENLTKILNSEHLSANSKLDTCKAAANHNWRSSKIARKWILDNVDKLGLLPGADEVTELQLLKSHCEENFPLSSLAAINNYNAKLDISKIEIIEGCRSFFASLRGAPSECDADYGLCTVVITAYNADDTLRYSIKSIVQQSYANIEIIIVDDGMNDKLNEILDEINHPRIRLVRNMENLGPYASRNAAIAIARGKYIAIQDADDWSHPQRLERQIGTLHANLGSSACYTRHLRFDTHGNLKLENNFCYLGDGPMTSVFRRQVFYELGGFLNVRTRGDMEFKHRLVSAHGETSILNYDGALLLSLDWDSNSKSYTNTSAKKAALSEFKAEYTILNDHIFMFAC